MPSWEIWKTNFVGSWTLNTRARHLIKFTTSTPSLWTMFEVGLFAKMMSKKTFCFLNESVTATGLRNKKILDQPVVAVKKS